MQNSTPQSTMPRSRQDCGSVPDDATPPTPAPQSSLRKLSPSPTGTVETEVMTSFTGTPTSVEIPVRTSVQPGPYQLDPVAAHQWASQWESRALFTEEDEMKRSRCFSDPLSPEPPEIPTRESIRTTTPSNSITSLPSTSRRRSRGMRRLKSGSVVDSSGNSRNWSSSSLKGSGRRQSSSSFRSSTSSTGLTQLFLPPDEEYQVDDVASPTASSSEPSSPDCSQSPKRDLAKKHRRRISSPGPTDADQLSWSGKLTSRALLMRNNKLIVMLLLVGFMSVGLTILTSRAVGGFRSDTVMDAEQLEEAIQRYERMHSVRVRRPQLPTEGGLRGKLVQSAGKHKDLKKHPEKRHEDTPSDKDEHHSNKKSSSHTKKTSSSSQTKKKTEDSAKKKISKTDSKKKKSSKPKKDTSSGLKKSSTSSSTKSVTRKSPLPFALPSKSLGRNREFESVDDSMFNTAEKHDGSLHPRVISLHDPITEKTKPRTRPVETYPAEFTDNTQLYSILDSDDERLGKMEIRDPYSDEQCVPMQDWQTTYHPSCNGMHEIGMDHMGGQVDNDLNLFGTKGFWRHAWRMDSHHLDQADTVVLKTLKPEHNFEDAHFEHDRIDAVAMERLTSSPHVINVFGFCGHSVITEYADGSRVGELADKSKKKPLVRLKIARDIANGLADVHGIDGDGNATFVHLDINPANVVSVGGTLKLNDFNIGIIRRWNTTSNTPCGFPAQYPNPQWRSPEEARNEQHLTEKVDIFSMGHIFFRLICGHEPWNKLEPGGRPTKEEVDMKVQKGKLPFIPEEIMKTKDKEVAAIRNAMLSCYNPDPEKRPSAREITNKLQADLDKLTPSTPVKASS